MFGRSLLFNVLKTTSPNLCKVGVKHPKIVLNRGDKIISSFLLNVRRNYSGLPPSSSSPKAEQKQPVHKEAEVKLRDGLASVILPVTRSNEKCAFPLYPHETVQDFVFGIHEERGESSSIILTDENGVRVSHSTLIGDLIKSPFFINIDDNSYRVQLAKQDEILQFAIGTPEIRDLTLKAYHIKIQERLKEKQRYHMPYEEYLQLCDSYGLTEEQSTRLSRAMHITGTALHFHDNEDLKGYLFLNPELITHTLVDALQLKFVARGLPVIKGKLQSLLTEYIPLHKKKLELDRRAHNAATWWMRAGFVYLVLQFGTLARFVWIDFNWDIMEPITYFVSLSTLMLGYIFFVLYKEEYTYNALEQRQRNKALRKLYIKEEFNWKRWNELHQQVEELKHMLGAANVPEELHEIEKSTSLGPPAKSEPVTA